MSGSDYSRLTMPMLRALAAGEDPKAVWQQVSAWRMAYEAAELQASRLGTHRDSLARVWRGPAADAYLAELDRQVESLTRVGEVAMANERQAQAVAFSVTETRQKVDDLYQQWKATHDAAGAHGQMATWRQQESLTEQARAVMREHADTVVQASRNLVPPQRYDVPPPWRIDSGVPIEKVGEGLGTPFSSSRPGSSIRTGSVAADFGDFIAPRPSKDSGTALAGGLLDSPQASAAQGLLKPGVPLPEVASGPLGTLPSVSRWVEPNTGRAIAPSVLGEVPVRVPSPNPTLKPSQSVERGGRSGNPVTGERPVGQLGDRVTPGMPLGAVAGMPARSTTTRSRVRVSSPGGVIAPRTPSRDAYVTADGHTFTMASPATGTPAVTGEVGWSGRLNREFDPDDPWAVAGGVPPVLAPGPEPIHDPGPGVIGIDR